MTADPAPANALVAGLEIAAALERRGVDYALGGALAYGIWAVPRGTVDVDLNVFAEPAHLTPVFAAFRDLGIAVDDDSMREHAERDGLFVVRHGPWRVDVFTPSIDFAWEAARRRVRVQVQDRSVWFLSAECLAVFKLLFFRSKDLVDLERLIATQQGRMDLAYVRTQIAEMMGEDDPRVGEWDRLVEHFGRD